MSKFQDEEQQATDAEVEDAINWLVRLTSGDVTSQELKDFEIWRRADNRHEVALSEARHLWVSMGTPLESYYQPDDIASFSSEEGFRSYFFRWQIILPILLILSIGVFAQNWLTRWQYDQYTSTGEQRMLSLEDGSKMWLDADSAADIYFSAGKRFVRLAYGEAFFDVVHNPLRPFIVEAGAGKVKALGTSFGVERGDNSMTVTVERGKVEVSHNGSSDMQLDANQQVKVIDGISAVQIKKVNAGQVLAWHTGKLVFENQSLSSILSVLKHYDKRVIMFDSDTLANIKLSSIIDIHHLKEWYDGLQQSLPVNVDILGPVVWVRKR
ncbi:FecR family protein [Marinomonas spartinae]|uniref:FecR family protein n=1 Tax=Marinomonas spartinae TaxID=1792290 RepID=UPI0018F2342D|nr:FecR family protein [Marinomonas spartinae]MBJ7556571.1 FecR family protein [Marinomonas spartinae]